MPGPLGELAQSVLQIERRGDRENLRLVVRGPLSKRIVARELRERCPCKLKVARGRDDGA